MARLIVKSPYIKGGGGSGAGGYAKYIGTRDGVELLPSGYMGYMAERPPSHGLFGDEDNIDMDTVMQELNEYPSNIWTHIVSLKREDAERLGYDHAAQWRNLLRTHRIPGSPYQIISGGRFLLIDVKHLMPEDVVGQFRFDLPDAILGEIGLARFRRPAIMWTWGWLPSSWKAAYQRKSLGGMCMASAISESLRLGKVM